jgi:hypothetical protein
MRRRTDWPVKQELLLIELVKTPVDGIAELGNGKMKLSNSGKPRLHKSHRQTTKPVVAEVKRQEMGESSKQSSGAGGLNHQEHFAVYLVKGGGPEQQDRYSSTAKGER